MPLENCKNNFVHYMYLFTSIKPSPRKLTVFKVNIVCYETEYSNFRILIPFHFEWVFIWRISEFTFILFGYYRPWYISKTCQTWSHRRRCPQICWYFIPTTSKAVDCTSNLSNRTIFVRDSQYLSDNKDNGYDFVSSFMACLFHSEWKKKT